MDSFYSWSCFYKILYLTNVSLIHSYRVTTPTHDSEIQINKVSHKRTWFNRFEHSNLRSTLFDNTEDLKTGSLEFELWSERLFSLPM